MHDHLRCRDISPALVAESDQILSELSNALDILRVRAAKLIDQGHTDICAIEATWRGYCQASELVSVQELVYMVAYAAIKLEKGELCLIESDDNPGEEWLTNGS